MKILIVTPTIDGSITADTFGSLWNFARDMSITVHTRAMMWGQDIVRTRNRAAREFLAGDWDVLWFVDADVSFTPQVPVAMLRSEFPLVAGAYPKKRIDFDRPRDERLDWTFVADPSVPVEEHFGRPFQRAQLIPMGCTMIRRSVFEAIDANMKASEYGDRYGGATHVTKNYFTLLSMPHPDGPDSLLPEDYSFTMRARLSGIEPYVLLDPICSHTGSMKFDAREIGKLP
jgi:hypothetical protein